MIKRILASGSIPEIKRLISSKWLKMPLVSGGPVKMISFPDVDSCETCRGIRYVKDPFPLSQEWHDCPETAYAIALIFWGWSMNNLQGAKPNYHPVKGCNCSGKFENIQIWPHDFVVVNHSYEPPKSEFKTTTLSVHGNGCGGYISSSFFDEDSRRSIGLSAHETLLLAMVYHGYATIARYDNNPPELKNACHCFDHKEECLKIYEKAKEDFIISDTKWVDILHTMHGQHEWKRTVKLSRHTPPEIKGSIFQLIKLESPGMCSTPLESKEADEYCVTYNFLAYLDSSG